MDKELKIQLEKKCIRDVMEYFKNKKLKMNDDYLWVMWRGDEPILKLDLKFNDMSKKVQYDFTDMYIVRQAIKQILKLELEELGVKYDPNLNNEENEFLLKFKLVDDKRGYCAAFDEEYDGKKPAIIIYEKKTYEGLQSDDPEVRIYACKQLFINIFHEIQHYRQFLMTQSPVSSIESLIYAKECCLKGILEDLFYSSDKDKGNYQAFSIENNANVVGYRKVNRILEQEDLYFKMLEKYEQDNLYNGVYIVNIDTRFHNKHFEYNEPRDKNDVATEILDETITKAYIKRYPILLKEYNLDKTKKRAVELILNLDNEIKQISSLQELKEGDKNNLIKDTKRMYCELIYQALKKDSKTNIEDMKKYFGKNRSIEILDQISNYLQEENIRCVGISQSFYEAAESYYEGEQKGKFPISKEEEIEVIEGINEFFAKRQEFLSQIYKQLYELTPETIYEATKKAEISKSEIDQVIIDIRHAEQALKIKESSLEERN